MSKKFFERALISFNAEVNAIVETLISSAGQACDNKIVKMSDKEFKEFYDRVMLEYRKRKKRVGGPEIKVEAYV